MLRRAIVLGRLSARAGPRLGDAAGAIAAARVQPCWLRIPGAVAQAAAPTAANSLSAAAGTARGLHSSSEAASRHRSSGSHSSRHTHSGGLSDFRSGSDSGGMMEGMLGERFAPSLGEYVVSDVGLTRFMGRVHATAAKAFSGSLLAAYAACSLAPAGFFAGAVLPIMGVSLVGAIGSTMWFFKSPYTVVTKYEMVTPVTHVTPTSQPDEESVTGTELGVPRRARTSDASTTTAVDHLDIDAANQGNMAPVYTAVNSDSRKAAFASFLAFETLVLLPMVDMANQINGMLVPGAAGITAMVMGGASLYAYKAKPTHMAAWKAPLAGGLYSLVGMSLAAIGSQLVFGPNAFTDIFFSAEPYVGIALFTGLAALDTYKAVEAYKAKQPDHLAAALQLFLDSMNLFVRILRLMLERQHKR